MTPQEFYEQTKGLTIDVDGAYGGQCWDLLAKFCQMVDIPLGVIHCSATGYVRDLWHLRKTSGILKYFDEVQTGQFKNGDWVIWDSDYNMTPQSHVAMYYDGKSYGQTVGRGTHLLPLDFSKAQGGFRWKGWSGVVDGMNVTEFQGVKLSMYKAPVGYGLYMLSAGEGKVKDIAEFDNDRLLILAMVNCGYFQMKTDVEDPYGTHYGVEQTYDGVDLAPKQTGLIAYYDSVNDGLQMIDASKYYYSAQEVNFACTPYSVLIHEGQYINEISTALGNKEGLMTAQTMVMLVDDRWVLCAADSAYPRTMGEYARSIGATEAILLDSGGSTQMMAYTGGQYQKIVYTGRQIPNVLCIAKEKPETGQISPNPSGNEEEEETPVTVSNPSETSLKQDVEKINWAQKLSSRKLWSAIIPVITGLFMLFGLPETYASRIEPLLMILLPPIVYILVEGWVDASRLKNQGLEDFLNWFLDELMKGDDPS